MPRSDYMASIQKELDWDMRQSMINWIVEIHNSLNMSPETLFLAVNIIDRLLSKKSVAESMFKLLGFTALFIASKHEDVSAPSIRDYIVLILTKNHYNEKDFIRAEQFILQAIDHYLAYPNPMYFLRRNSKADHSNSRFHALVKHLFLRRNPKANHSNSKSHTLAKYLMEVTLIDYTFISYKPSMIAAASLYVARAFLSCGEWVRNEKIVIFLLKKNRNNNYYRYCYYLESKSGSFFYFYRTRNQAL